MALARPSLEGLLLELSIEITARLNASSLYPMEDLRNLQAMREACKARHVGQCIPLWWVLQREQFHPYYNRRYRDRLIDKLARVSNTEAYFRKGMRIIFVENRGAFWPPLDMLERATKDGHNLAVYTLTMCLYRRNGGTDDNKKVMRQLRKVEGEEEPGAVVAAIGGRTKTTWANRASVRSHWLAMDMVRIVEPPAHTTARPKVAMPMVRGGHQCAGGGCGELDGWDTWDKWTMFCSKDCRIRFE